MESVDIFLDEKRLSSSPGTIKQYRAILKAFSTFLGRETVSAKRPDIVRYLNRLMFDKELSKTTVSNVLSVIKSYYSFLLDNGYVESDPTKGISHIRPDKKAPIYLTQAEIKALIETASDLRDNLMVSMLYATGVRVSELVNIKKKDIDFERNTVIVFGKGAKERIVLVPETLTYRLRYYCGGLGSDDLLFDLTPRTVQRNIKSLSSKAGIRKKVTPHKLRHSFATHMLQNGGNVVAIQKLLGHTSLNTTQIYTHYDVDELKDMYARTHPLASNGTVNDVR